MTAEGGVLVTGARACGRLLWPTETAVCKLAPKVHLVAWKDSLAGLTSPSFARSRFAILAGAVFKQTSLHFILVRLAAPALSVAGRQYCACVPSICF